MHVRFVLRVLAHGDILHFEKLSYFKDSQLQKSSLLCLEVTFLSSLPCNTNSASLDEG